MTPEGEIGDREFIVGERFSIADIALASQLSGMRLTRVAIDAERWPNLANYVETHLARPSFATRLEELKSVMPASDFEP